MKGKSEPQESSGQDTESIASGSSRRKPQQFDMKIELITLGDT